MKPRRWITIAIPVVLVVALTACSTTSKSEDTPQNVAVLVVDDFGGNKTALPSGPLNSPSTCTVSTNETSNNGAGEGDHRCPGHVVAPACRRPLFAAFPRRPDWGGLARPRRTRRSCVPDSGVEVQVDDVHDQIDHHIDESDHKRGAEHRVPRHGPGVRLRRL